MADPDRTLNELTVEQAHAAFRDGSLTARALVEHYLGRIAGLDREGPQLNAVLAVSPTALDDADRLDAELARTGTLSGPLHGIPVVLKDQVETAGLTTTFGNELAADYVPERDATVVTRLREAGAVVLAKTTMPDFATSWFSTSSVSGLTRNPYALDRDPGGSSSGTAAAVAANLALLGVGEDTGGSIRLPASFCNLVGVRVTPGLVSRDGMSPLVRTQDTAGPMTRTVADAARLLDVIAGFDPRDDYTAAFGTARPGGSFTQHLGTDALTGSRIGVLRQAFGPQDEPESAAVNGTVEAALARLTDAGAVLVDVEIPDLADKVAYTSVYTTRSHQDMDQFFASRPTLPVESVDAVLAAGAYHDRLDLFEAIAASPADPRDDPEYVDRLLAQQAFQREVVSLMVASGLDAICFPDVTIAAPTHADVMGRRWTCLTFPTNTVIASQLLLPAVTVPAGLTEDGLPVGLELMGVPFDEARLLGLASGVEAAVAARREPQLP